MKRNFNQVLKAIDGSDLKGTPDREMVDQQGRIVVGDDLKPMVVPGEVLTLKSVAVNALLAQHESERDLTGEEKVRRYKLAQAIHAANCELDVTSEDITLLKRLIGRSYVPVVVGRVYDILES